MAVEDGLCQKTGHNEEHHRQIQAGTGHDYPQEHFVEVTKDSRDLSHQEPNQRSRDYSAGPSEHQTSKPAVGHSEEKTHRETDYCPHTARCYGHPQRFVTLHIGPPSRILAALLFGATLLHLSGDLWESLLGGRVAPGSLTPSPHGTVLEPLD